MEAGKRFHRPLTHNTKRQSEARQYTLYTYDLLTQPIKSFWFLGLLLPF
jgi:hypothetical protein